ncbi:MAG: NUDIX domain-containing protein [Candidatus Paceibacterota bacterium]
MKITENYIGKSGVEYVFEYEDADSFDHLEYEKCQQTYGVCFCEDKMVIQLNGKTDLWGLVGGTVEPGEKLEETLKREIQEESNMKVLSCLPIGTFCPFISKVLFFWSKYVFLLSSSSLKKLF